MSDSEGVEIQFEERTGEPEIVNLEGNEIPAEVEDKKDEGVTLTRTQYDALMKEKDQSGVLGAGLKELAETLKPKQQGQAGPVYDNFDPLALEEEAFKPGKFAEVVGRISQRAVSQYQGQTAPLMQGQNKQILKLDPATKDLYKRYETLIEEKVAALPPQYRALPNVFEIAYRQVVEDKRDEIVEDRAKVLAEEMIKKMGLEEKGKTAQSTAMYVEGAPRAAMPAPKAKNVIYMTQKDQAEMISSGMNPRDKDQVLSYLEWKKERGIK